MPDSQPKESPFTISKVKESISLILTVGGILWIIFGYGRDIKDNNENITKTNSNMAQGFSDLRQLIKDTHEQDAKDIKEIRADVARIDKEGTQYGARSFLTRSNEMDQTVKRVDKIQETVDRIGPLVNRIDEKMEWVSAWVKGQAMTPPELGPVPTTNTTRPRRP